MRLAKLEALIRIKAASEFDVDLYVTLDLIDRVHGLSKALEFYAGSSEIYAGSPENSEGWIAKKALEEFGTEVEFFK